MKKCKTYFSLLLTKPIIMTIKNQLPILLLLLFCVSSTQGQISINTLTVQEAMHQDSAYHCTMCEEHLFDTEEGTIIGEEIHYHGVATDETITAFHCVGCSSHLGYHNHETVTYQLVNTNVAQDDTNAFLCLSCQMPIFDQQALTDSDDSFYYFDEPIDKERIVLEERNKFYTAEAQTPNLKCSACKGIIGEVSPNNTGGFGLRVNLNAVKKKKRP